MTPTDLAGLCERLRGTFLRFNMGHREEPLRNPDGPEAAAAIESLVAALEPFAVLAVDEANGVSGVNVNDPISKWLTVADLVRARTAIEGASDDR